MFTYVQQSFQIKVAVATCAHQLSSWQMYILIIPHFMMEAGLSFLLCLTWNHHIYQNCLLLQLSIISGCWSSRLNIRSRIWTALLFKSFQQSQAESIGGGCPNLYLISRSILRGGGGTSSLVCGVPPLTVLTLKSVCLQSAGVASPSTSHTLLSSPSVSG